MFLFFNSHLATSRPSLGHFLGGGFNYLILISYSCGGFDPQGSSGFLKLYWFSKPSKVCLLEFERKLLQFKLQHLYPLSDLSQKCTHWRLTIFAKSYIFNVWQGSTYTCQIYGSFSKLNSEIFQKFNIIWW